MSDTLQTIVRRYQTNIEDEAKLLREQQKAVAGTCTRLHNFASPCEMLAKYWGEKYEKATNFRNTIPMIRKLAEKAREAEKLAGELEEKLFALNDNLKNNLMFIEKMADGIPDNYVVEYNKERESILVRVE